MKIIYVHHGQRELNIPPTQNDDLTPLGYEDCALVAQLLNTNKIKDNLRAIYTSSFFRCTTTAQIINKQFNVPIINDDRLNEFKSVKNETWVQLQTRVNTCIEEIINKHNKDDVVICVTSGVNICAFINRAYNLQPSENAPFLGVPSCSPIIFDFTKK